MRRICYEKRKTIELSTVHLYIVLSLSIKKRKTNQSIELVDDPSACIGEQMVKTVRYDVSECHVCNRRTTTLLGNNEEIT